MKRFALICVLVVVTAVLFLVTEPEGRVLGMRLVCSENGLGDPCWIAAVGVGVIALGVGAGLLTFGAAGFGLFFAVGQGAAGLMVVGQLAIGVVAFLGQVASGLVGMGQGGLGYLTVTQGGSDNARGRAYLGQLSAELDEVLRLW